MANRDFSLRMIIKVAAITNNKTLTKTMNLNSMLNLQCVPGITFIFFKTFQEETEMMNDRDI